MANIKHSNLKQTFGVIKGGPRYGNPCRSYPLNYPCSAAHPHVGFAGLQYIFVHLHI